MDINPVGEIWQAMSILSDAQEDIHNGEHEEAVAKMDHAKRHLIQALEYYKAQNPEMSLEGFKVIFCTLTNS